MTIDIIPGVIWIQGKVVNIHIYNLFYLKKQIERVNTDTSEDTFKIYEFKGLDVLDHSFVEKLKSSKKLYKRFLLSKFFDLMFVVKDKEYEFSVNVEKITISNVEQNLKFIKLIVDMFYKLNYTEPENVFLYNTPYTFQSIWKLVKNFIDKNTVDKVIIVGKNETKKNLVAELST